MKNFLKKFKVVFILLAVVAVACGIFLDPIYATGVSLGFLPGLASLSREEIEALAMAKLSDSFGGNPYENMAGNNPYENFDGLDEEDVFDGSEDVSISFVGNATSFRNEKISGVEVSYTINNDTSSKITVALANGAITDATVLKNSFGADCYLKDGVMKTVGEKTVVGTGVGTIAGIDGFTEFSKRNAFRVTNMVIQATNNSDGSVNIAAYNKMMFVQRFSPFRKFGEERINLFKYFLTSQQRNEKIEVDLSVYNVQRDDQTIITMDIDAGVTITITETIGAIQNSAATLFNKAVKASENIAKGTAGVMRPRDLRVKARGVVKTPVSSTPGKASIAAILSKLKK